jgi:DHA1 family tetracycline resistance protein-like MFS transporter
VVEGRASDRLPRQIWVLVVAAFLIAIGFGIVAPTLPVFVRSFDVGVTAVSLAVSSFALSRLLFAPLAGRFVGRSGELPVYLTGLGVLSASTTEPAARFRDAVSHSAYRAALVASFANGWAVFGVRIALVPLLVVEVLGRSESWAGIALAVFAAGNAATLTVTGRITDRIGRRPPMLVGLAVSGVSTAALGLVTSAPLFLAVSLVAGMGSGLVNPPMNAAVADVIGSGARGGTVLAGFQMAADFGAIVGPVVAGALAEGAGYSVAFLVTGAVALVALAFWVRAPETLVRRTTEEAEAQTS